MMVHDDISKTHHENPQAHSSLASTSQKMYPHNSLWAKVGYSSQNSGYHETSNMSLESSEFHRVSSFQPQKRKHPTHSLIEIIDTDCKTESTICDLTIRDLALQNAFLYQTWLPSGNLT